jgi:hypothetical protein
MGKAAEYMTGSPSVGAAVQTVGEALPAMIGARGMVRGKISPQRQYTKAVKRGVKKGVKKGSAGHKYYGQYRRYIKDAGVGVDEILKREKALQYFDSENNIVKGKLPRTIHEFEQVLEQVKNEIYTEYDSLAGLTDKRGGAVTTRGAIESLQKEVINNPMLQTASKETINYAMRRIQDLTDTMTVPGAQPSILPKTTTRPKSFNATETQNFIKLLNQSNQAAFKNPTPQMVGRAHVDALIAKELRAGLDVAIQRATGNNYAALKRKYGALRMLEEDVAKRSQQMRGANVHGLFDFSDVFASSQVTYGLTSGQPALVASGIAAKAVSSLYKFRNNPNTVIKSMFKKTRKIRKRQARPSGIVNPALIFGTSAGQS